MAVEATKRGELALLIPVVQLAAAAKRGPALATYLQGVSRVLQDAASLRRCVFIFDGLDEGGAAKREVKGKEGCSDPSDGSALEMQA